MLKKDIDNYGPLTAVIRETITRKQARFEVSHPDGQDIFEYDDSSERRDQLRNAVYFAQSLVDSGKVMKIVDKFTDPDMARRITIKNGMIVKG